MIIAIDVHYRETFAKVVSIEFANWQDTEPTHIHIQKVNEVAEYISGEFYKRELPCILEILTHSDLTKVKTIIVDSYVQLDDKGKAGLGKYLYQHLNEKIPIIGVAKKGFANNHKNVIPITRGESQNPLYITAIGTDLQQAADKIKNMHGEYRMPDLLRILDQKTKE